MEAEELEAEVGTTEQQQQQQQQQQQPQVPRTRSQVRGPTSALSSFLREKGIRPPTQTRYQRIPQEEEQMGSSRGFEDVVSVLVDHGVEDAATVGSIALEIAQQGAASSSSKFTGRKKRKAEPAEPEGDGKKRKKAIRAPLPALDPISQLVRFCSSCERRFIVGSDPDQTACTACQNVAANTTIKPTPAQKRAMKMKKDMALQMTGSLLDGFILPLRDMCITYIVENINLVDGLGEMLPETKRKLSRIISKQRKLTNASLPLFLGPHEDTVQLYDCTLLDQDALASIPKACPNLRILELGFCGRMTDKVLDSFSYLDELQEISLYGPFLCSPGGFAGLFQSLKALKSVKLEFAAKFTNDSLEYLARECPMLEELILTDCSFVDDVGVAHISSLTTLKSLGLNALGAITDSCMVDLLSKIGSSLETLSLNKHAYLGNETLLALSKHTSQLSHLSIQNCILFDNDSMVEYFSKSQPLRSIDLSGLNVCQDDCIKAIISHHGKQLSRLVLNGLDQITMQSLQEFLKDMLHLSHCDLSWVRCVNDDFLVSFLSHCSELETIKLFGCHQLTSISLNAPWTNQKGKRILISGNEFD
jgi:DNA repair protein RAD7